jgi:hypothetical protein
VQPAAEPTGAHDDAAVPESSHMAAQQQQQQPAEHLEQDAAPAADGQAGTDLDQQVVDAAAAEVANELPAGLLALDASEEPELTPEPSEEPLLSEYAGA